MLAQQRQALIVEEVRRHGAVRVSELVAKLNVSDMTVRRDLESLARRGLLDKVHGGATAPSDYSTDEPGFVAKSSREQPEKDAIADAAAALVQPGTAVGLSAGTTTYALAQRLSNVAALTVVTNSTRVADVLHESSRPDRVVILTGGIRTPSEALVGPVAVNTLRSLHLDIVFLGVHGMDARSGFTTPNLLESDTNRALLEAGRNVVVVADHTKWNVVGISTIAQLEEADVLVTDEGLGDDARSVLEERVGELVVATSESP
ncbi:MAG: DeoR/GlpR family DNA-binding transcription regulator [Nocardioidaceae bacterium]